MADAKKPTGGAGGNSSRSTEPAFQFENNDESDDFNLTHRDDYNGPIPEDQRKVSYDAYEARNILKLLKADRAFGKKGPYDEFIRRVVQAARAGCVARYAEPSLAIRGLEQIRMDIVRRVGRPLVYRYLGYLAGWALSGAALGLLMIIAARRTQGGIEPYGWVVIGAMAGAWFSVAASRWQIAFETLPAYLDILYEPFVRMLFVLLVAFAFALFLDLAVISIKIGNTDLAAFTKSPGVALLVGFIAGIGERALSVQLIERAQKVLNPNVK